MRRLMVLTVSALAAAYASAVFGAGMQTITTFEDGTAPAALTGGDVAELADAVSYSGTLGYPSGAATTHQKVYAVEGEATYGTAASPLLTGGTAHATVDMLFKATSVSDALTRPTAPEGMMMLGVDGGKVVIGSKDGEGVQWTDGPAVSEGQWVRVTFLFTYSASDSTCRVLIDGASAGVFTPFGNYATSSSFAGVTVAGTTQIDEIVVSDAVDAGGNDATFGALTVADANGTSVPVQWMVDNGASNPNADAASTKQTLKVSQCYLAGLDPNGADAALTVTDVTTSSDKVTFTIPSGINGTAKIQTRASTADAWQDAAVASSTADTISLALPDSGALYYQLVVVPK